MVDEEKCAEYGLDPKAVASIANRISRAAKEAKRLGLTIFGGAGSGSLRYGGTDLGGHHTEVATLDGSFDGGDGGDSW